MPKGKKKKKGGRRGGRKGGGGAYALGRVGKYTMTNNTGFAGWPPHFYDMFIYDATFQVSNAAGVATQQTFNLNSCFDPDRTGTGHQPHPWDTIAGVMYNRYRVLKTRWMVDFGPANNTVMCLAVALNSLPPVTVVDQATFDATCEFSRCKARVVPAYGKDIYSKGAFALNTLAGATKTEYLADDRYEAAYNASPTEVIALVLAIYNPNATTVVSNYNVKLVYYVDLHDPITTSVSYWEKRVAHLRKVREVKVIQSGKVEPEPVTEFVQSVV